MDVSANEATEPWGYKDPHAEVSIEEFEALIGEAYAFKKEIKDLEGKAEEIKEKLNEKQAKIQAIMEQLGKSEYQSDSGRVKLDTKMSVEVPKDPESKAQFFAWLEDKGIFLEYATVNSQKLNTLYNSEVDATKKIDLEIPGLGKAKPYKTLKLLK